MADPTPPVAEDEFPEFAAPPRHKPAVHEPRTSAPAKDTPQDEVDSVIERLRRERKEGKR